MAGIMERPGGRPGPLADPFPELPELGSEEEYPPGTLLFHQGHRPIVVNLIVGDGLVKKVRTQPDGTEVIVALRAEGWLLGAGPVLLNRANSGSALTISRCRLRSMPASALLDLINRNQLVALWALRMFARAARELEVARGELAACPGRERVVRALKDFAHAQPAPKRGTSIVLRPPINKREFAQLVGLSRQQLNDILHALMTDGLLKEDRGCFLLETSFWSKVEAGDV